MTYRNSLLSLYPPTKQNVDLAAQFDEELPATAPVFEGHLYLRTDNKQWQWRLFRFDGTCFTCLSTRKVKLPPNTRVDAPTNEHPFIHSMPSFTSTSLTSPLLATPKNKSRQQSTTSLPAFAKYYQLPKWTVDVVNISAVSVLKPSGSKLGMVGSTKSSRCFCVRTFDGDCYIMKAQKQKDLERWLFVLTKMWKFAQAMKQQVLSQQPQQQTVQQYQSQDSIPLSQMYQRPLLQKSTMDQSPSAAPVDDDGYEKHYQHPSLSVEKLECIDAWRQSLDELMASDPPLGQSQSPPPIESIPDDDQVSAISDMTSISHRKPSELLSLKKKRSNDVKNWIEPRKPSLPLIDTYHVSYFQDCKTTTARSTTTLDSAHGTTRLDRHAKYHSSTRAKQIQIINTPLTNDRRQSYSPQHTQPTPLPARRSLDNTAKYHPPILAESPLYSLAHVDQDEEDISLADLQRSLKRASLQNRYPVTALPPYHR